MLHKFFLECFQYSLTGRLAQGIVHNLNGPLQILSMQMEMLNMDLLKFYNLPPSCVESLDESEGMTVLQSEVGRINERVQQASEVITRLESMIRVLGYRGVDNGEEKYLKPVDIRSLLEDFIEFWNADLYFKHRVEKKIRFPESSIFPVIDEAEVLAMMDGIMSGFLLCIKGMEGSSFGMACLPVGQGSCRIEFEHTGIPVPDEICERIASLRNSYQDDGEAPMLSSLDMSNNPALSIALLLGAVKSVDAGWTFELSPRSAVISQS